MKKSVSLHYKPYLSTFYMNALQLNIPMKISDLAYLLREQLSAADRLTLVDLLIKEEPAPSKQQILADIKTDYIAAKKGVLGTQKADDFVAELQKEGLL
jgi:hypothetical protein